MRFAWQDLHLTCKPRFYSFHAGKQAEQYQSEDRPERTSAHCKHRHQTKQREKKKKTLRENRSKALTGKQLWGKQPEKLRYDRSFEEQKINISPQGKMRCKLLISALQQLGCGLAQPSHTLNNISKICLSEAPCWLQTDVVTDAPTSAHD